MVIDEPDQEPTYDWMQPLKMYLENHPLSNNNAKVERLARKSRMYHLIDGISFRRGANGMMMKCIFREEGIKLFQDIHSFMWIILIMVFYHRQSFQTRILLAHSKG
jgi:hypothetical protein